MRSLRYLNSVLTILAVLLALQLWTHWTGEAAYRPGTGLTTASEVMAAGGGIPNAGAQRKQMIDQLKRQTDAIENLTEMFRNGQAKIRMLRDSKDKD